MQTRTLLFREQSSPEIFFQRDTFPNFETEIFFSKRTKIFEIVFFHRFPRKIYFLSNREWCETFLATIYGKKTATNRINWQLSCLLSSQKKSFKHLNFLSRVHEPPTWSSAAWQLKLVASTWSHFVIDHWKSFWKTLFLYLNFSKQLTDSSLRKICRGGLRTAELLCQKRPLYQLSHHFCPKATSFLTYILKTTNLDLT